MKAVLLNDSACVLGGSDRVAIDAALGLAALGVPVTFVAGHGPVDADLAACPGVTVRLLFPEATGEPSLWASLWNRASGRRLREVLAEHHPDETIIQVHRYSRLLTGAAVAAALDAGFRTVLTLHDFFITCPNGAYFVYPTLEYCERRALSLDCLRCNCDARRPAHKAWRVGRAWVQSRLARLPERLSGYIAVSENCAEVARRDLPPGARIVTVPNPVNAVQRPPAKPSEKREFVFFGRFEPSKGATLLARAAGDLDVSLTFCGAGPEEAELRRLAPRAHFPGWLKASALDELLGRARAVIFPSVFRETFGLAAAETLARGIPLVASAGTAADAFLRHGENCLQVKRGDVAGLRAAILALAADDALVARLGRQAYDGYWAAPFTREAHAAHLEKVFTDFLSGPSRRPGTPR